MTELYGVLTVIILFLICILLSCFICFLKLSLNKNSDANKRKSKSNKSQIFYLTEKKPTQSTYKKRSVPIEATLISAEDLKKYFEKED